jgi:hypothetical protein
MNRLRVSLGGRNKDAEERNVTISFSQSPERATETCGRVPLVYIYINVIPKHARIRLQRCVQIATPSVNHFRRLRAQTHKSTNGQLFLYI